MSSEKNPDQGGLLPLAPAEEDHPPPRPPRPTQEYTDQNQYHQGHQEYHPPEYTQPQQSQSEYPPEKQPQNEAAPPSYEQGGFVPPPEKTIPPPPPPQTHEEVGSGSGQHQEKDFPPPPPGPPPAQSHPDPLKAHPIEPQTQTYTIPQYNPADPIFAPPPTQPADSETPVAVSDTSTEKPHKKQGWGERFTSLGMKAAAPINSLAHKLGSQSFLPETLDKECEKAASTLKTFCAKGVYADPEPDQPPTSTDPKATETSDTVIDPTKNKPKSRVIVTIPPKVISKAVGLAIFTTLRAGFNVSGATGSGILIARLPDGSWGPPSGIQVHSVGGGFSIGLDIYDCVCVINSREALAAFTKTRVGLGTDLAVVAGPYGAGGAVEFGTAVEKSDGKKKDKDEKTETENVEKPEKPKSSLKPVFSYVKSRGFYAGIQIDGTVVVERKDANAAFYGDRVPVDKILKGEVPPQGPTGMWPTGARVLLETLKGAEAGMKEKDSAGPATGPGPAPGPAPPAGDAEPPVYVDDGVQRPVADHKYK